MLSKSRSTSGRPGWRFWLLTAYLIALATSYAVRATLPDRPVPAGVITAEVASVDGDRRLERKVRLAWYDRGPGQDAWLDADDPGQATELDADDPAPVIVLIHGSPGAKENFAGMIPPLAREFRVLAPDLPGFGDSERDVPDYSIRAHARYVFDMLDRAGVDRPVHVVGFSLGGGVGLEIFDEQPERVASMTLLSSIGVQELELFGSYGLNHAVHAVQLAAVWFAVNATPHFGALDDAFLGLPYARNFYDTDQRPLRGILERIEVPLLIVHGVDDFLVFREAADEHHRIVPHSELEMRDASHFMVFQEPEQISALLTDWVRRVEAGEVPRRGDATAERFAAAAVPYDPRSAPPFHGMALILSVVLIALATLVSEDLTCVATGLIVAQGRMSYFAGVLGCFLGIFVGDLLLFAAGRILGRPALSRAPLRWFLGEDQVLQASRWLDSRGPIVVMLSRFLPGFRLPTYFAAGMLHTRLRAFGMWFLIAAFLWTPLLVWISMQAGEQAFRYLDWLHSNTWLALIGIGVWILIVVRLIVPMFSFRGRRLLVRRRRRLVGWEFWPLWVFYAPVVLHWLWLGLRYRNGLLFTACNPAMPASGFISEPKHEILNGLRHAGDTIATWRLVGRDADPEARVAGVRRFLAEQHLDYPVVLKPDAGQRGSGVVIARDEAQVREYFAGSDFETLVQEYVDGAEFGLFYARLPGDERGRIISITEKQMPVVVGDGRQTLERLILLDRRAVAMAPEYFKLLGARTEEIPAAGEVVQLAELGTHCRGAIFLDGKRFHTPELERAVDEISRGYDGFFFGRYDVRVPDGETLARGESLKVIELNGVTSESTHIYDPSISLFQAWGTLFRQWRLAFEIGAGNRDRGAHVASLGELLRMMREYRATSRTHPEMRGRES